MKSIKNFLLASVFAIIAPLSVAYANTNPIDPNDIISKELEAQYFEKYLGYIEVGTTTKTELEEYIGEGIPTKTSSGEKVYYIDTKNKRTLIIDTDFKGRIEVAHYKAFVELPPNVKKLDDIKLSKKLNIKNFMTSMGSRIGYNTTMIMNAYGRPSVELINKDEKELKYIMIGSNHKDQNFVYLEYAFRLKKNKVQEIRIENGK
ncbi:MAG: hypothetical protein U0457_14525 [Candidatus Sericytochromatia bacterium]